MEQIYYTQCPMGYGLGASNGFQIKRLSAGYPVAGDFRFLGLRAFLAGTKILAPPALRYRRDGDVAEIARMTPRAQEYQTERGFWGRPGGHFAHGLRLDAGELAALANWPAGLFDAPAWRQSDPEPSRGRPPDPVELGLPRSPTFAAVAPMVAGEDPDWLARLLTALAGAAREGRTLYLIDEPGRLAGRVAWLTFAFPRALRSALTFSTYHDRPEELPGFRLQGTIAAARPNRAALAASGVIADLVAGTFEPAIEPARWARKLAGWFVRGRPEDERAWVETDARAARARTPTVESPWDDAWLDRLIGFHEVILPPASPPADREGWASLADLAAWSARLGLGGELARARGPGWWTSIAEAASVVDARRALVAHGLLAESWEGAAGEAASAWGAAVARWLAGAESTERVRSIGSLLKAAPAAARPAFLAAAIRGLPRAIAASTLARLKAGSAIDPAILLPLEVRGAAGPALERGQVEPLREVLRRALDRPAVLPAALDALAAEATDRPEALDTLAPVLADLFEGAEALDRDEALAWVLGRPDAADWLSPYLDRLFGPPQGPESWRALRDRTPTSLLPALARVILGATAGPGRPDAPLRWAVEEVLLPIAEAGRPHDPGWPHAYLAHTPSGLDLVKKLFAKGRRNPDLKRWLGHARDRGEVSAAQDARIRQAQAYARALATGDARSLMSVELPEVPPADRGPLLGQILGHVGGATVERLDICLESCRLAWPGAFDPGVDGLAALSRPLAEALLAYRGAPDLWLDNLRRMIDRLGLPIVGGRGFESDSLAAEIVAATTRWPEPPFLPWRFRQYLLDRDDAWRILAIDARRDGLEGDTGPDVLERWDGQIDKPRTIRRFFELMFNACDGPALAACLMARASDLRSLEHLPWWPSARTPGATDDLRDGLARLAPMAPLDGESLQPIRAWMRAPSRPVASSIGRPDGDTPDLVPIDSQALPADPAAPHLSPFGLARWRCLDGLSTFYRPGLNESGRWQVILSWMDDRLPLDRLDREDGYRFAAWVIARTESLDSVQVARLARWLVGSGLTDPDRLGGWADALSDRIEVPDASRIDRLAMVGDLRAEVKNVLRDEAEGRRKP